MGTKGAHATVVLFVVSSACGGGVITAEDVTPGQAVAIGVLIVVALLFVAYVGGRRRGD